MAHILILHGTGSNSQDNWFPWLKAELEKAGHEVWVPNLPNATQPNVHTYNQFLLANRPWDFNGAIIIGHSSGSVAILGLLQQLPAGEIVRAAILVGSFNDNMGRADLTDLFLEPFNFPLIQKRAQKFIFIHSDNDPRCPLEGAQYLHKQLGGQFILKPGQGHFNLEKGPEYKQFSDLLALVQSLTD